MDLPVFSAYVFSEKSQPSQRDVASQEKLTFVARDGSVHTIRYIKSEGGGDEKSFSIPGNFEGADIHFHEGDVEKVRKILKIKTTSDESGKVLESILSTARIIEEKYLKNYLLYDKTQIQKKERQSEVKYQARAFHLLTGIIATPVAMLQGIKRLAAVAMQVATAAFNVLQDELRDVVVDKKRDVEKIPVTTFRDKLKTLSSLSETWTKDARKSLLQMIPMVGSQLANQYHMGGSLKEFYKAPAIGGILEDAHLSAPEMVYGLGVRSRLESCVKKDLQQDLQRKKDEFHEQQNIINQVKEDIKEDDNIVKCICKLWATGILKQSDNEMLEDINEMLKDNNKKLGYVKFNNINNIIELLKELNNPESRKQIDVKELSQILTRAMNRMEKEGGEFLKELEEYYKKPNPSIDAAKRIVDNLRKDFPHESSVTVRIPTKDGRSHDATLKFAKGAKANNKTVVLYHGNAGHRNEEMMETVAEEFLKQGYNVLQASYAGDKVIVGQGTDYEEKPTSCNEFAMRGDSEADLEFLKALGVNELGVFGYSLGGAQAMNFAQAVGKDESLAMEYLVLDRTFTSMVDVASRAVKNALGSSLMGRVAYDLAEKSLRSDERKGCDGLNNKEKISQVLKKKPFQQTTIRIFGAEKDTFMGDQENRVENFSRDLFECSQIESEGMADIQLQMVPTNHLSYLSEETLRNFLFGQSTEEALPIPSGAEMTSAEKTPVQLDVPTAEKAIAPERMPQPELER